MTPLFESASGIAAANGRAVARLQPMRAFETWQIKTITVQSTSTVSIPEARVYKGNETPSAFVDGSVNGSNDSNTTADVLLQNGESLLVVWTGCDTGARCTVTISGTKR